MRGFFRSLLATLAGLILFTGGLFLLLCLAIAVKSGSDATQNTVVPGSYLVFDISVNITDRPRHTSFADAAGRLFSGQSDVDPTLQLRSVTRAIRSAATDSRIAGLYLTGSLRPNGLGSGFAALKEVRAALQEFKATKKPILAYLDDADTRDYYLAAGADELAIAPFGDLSLVGLAAQPVFFAEALEKLGVGVQYTRVGKYKSYVEQFTRTNMSPESRAEETKLLGDLWGVLVADIGADRQIAPSAFQKVVDEQGLLGADAAIHAGLATRAAYQDEILTTLKERTEVGQPGKPFKQVRLVDYEKTLASPKRAPSGPRIAIVYAEGAIVDGNGDTIDDNAPEVGGRSFSRAIRRLREDADVKAIVLRVNSPGGAVGASAELGRELELARASKPLVVSMGSYAASGGYWIAAYGDRIFASPNTITGSIGVFALFPNIKKLANNLGITTDSITTGKFAEWSSILHPKTDAELAIVQRRVDWTYNEFIGVVAKGRNLERDAVEQIAQGRVWSGIEAMKIGLVDEMGGLDEAIAYAAEKAKLGTTFETEEYPKPKSVFEDASRWFGETSAPAADGAGIATRMFTELKAQLRSLDQFNDPRGLYVRLPIQVDAN